MIAILHGRALHSYPVKAIIGGKRNVVPVLNGNE
jgi:hypothetical protein